MGELAVKGGAEITRDTKDYQTAAGRLELGYSFSPIPIAKDVFVELQLGLNGFTGTQPGVAIKGFRGDIGVNLRYRISIDAKFAFWPSVGYARFWGAQAEDIPKREPCPNIQDDTEASLQCSLVRTGGLHGGHRVVADMTFVWNGLSLTVGGLFRVYEKNELLFLPSWDAGARLLVGVQW